MFANSSEDSRKGERIKTHYIALPPPPHHTEFVLKTTVREGFAWSRNFVGVIYLANKDLVAFLAAKSTNEEPFSSKWLKAGIQLGNSMQWVWKDRSVLDCVDLFSFYKQWEVILGMNQKLNFRESSVEGDLQGWQGDQHLLRSHCVPGTVLDVLHTLGY